MLMATFLSLPLEIRLVILKLVVNSERIPPVDRPESTDRILPQHRHTQGWYDHSVFCIPDDILCAKDPSHYRPNASSLLRTNRQLKIELEMLFKAKDLPLLNYKLDLAIMQGRELWPTWTSIPRKASTFNELAVTIRAAGPGPPCLEAFRAIPHRSPPGRYVWWLFVIIERLLMYGLESPDNINKEFECGNGKCVHPKQQLAIRVMDINFIDSIKPFPNGLELVPSYVPETTNVETDRKCRHCNGNCHGILYPVFDTPSGWSADQFFIWYTEGLYELITETYATWQGDLFYQGIEKLRFRLRGDLKVEFDLAQMLEQRPIETGYDPEETHRRMLEIYDARKRFDLECRDWKALDDEGVWLTTVPSIKELVKDVNESAVAAFLSQY